jgi:hypothetical protein
MGTHGQMLELDDCAVTFNAVGNMLSVTVDTDPLEPPTSWTLDLAKDGKTLRDWLNKVLKTEN